MMLTSLPPGGPDSVPVTDPPGTLLISGAEGIEITVKAGEGTVIGVPYYWQNEVWQPLIGDATVTPRQVKAVAGGVDVGHLYFNKPATPLWFAVLETGGGTVNFCDIREADGAHVLGQQDVTGAGGGGGGGGTVTQGAGSGVPSGGWTAQLSNGSAFYNALTDAELRAAPVVVSAASLPLPSGAATEATLASIDSKLTAPLSVTGPLTDAQLRASAVAVSAATLPLPTGAATFAAQTDGTQRARLTDGTNDVAVASAAPVGTEQALVVRNIPSGTQAVSGTMTVVQPTAASLNATIVGTTSDNSTNSTAKLPVVGARANAAAPTWAEGNQVPLSTDLAGSLRVSTVGTTTTTNASIGATAAAVPASATFVAGTDANGNLRGLAVNADNDANPSNGKVVVLAGVTKNTAPTWQNNKVVPLWVDTTSALAMTSAAQGAAAATASAWPIKVTDGTQTVTLLNSTPVGTEYALPVRPALVAASTSSVTSPSVTPAFGSILAANSAAVFRSFFNPNSSPIGLTLGGTGAVAPGMLLAPGQTWIMPSRSDGKLIWTGVVNGSTVTGGTLSIVVTEIT